MLGAGDAANPTQLFEELGTEPVQRCRAVLRQRGGDRLVVLDRQRRLDRDPPLDRVRDLTGRLGIALALEELREQTGDRRSQSYTGNPHRRDATGRSPATASGPGMDRSRCRRPTSLPIPAAPSNSDTAAATSPISCRARRRSSYSDSCLPRRPNRLVRDVPCRPNTRRRPLQTNSGLRTRAVVSSSTGSSGCASVAPGST